MKSEQQSLISIGNKFDNLVSRSKSYINTRDEADLVALRNNLLDIKLNLDTALQKNKDADHLNYLTALKLVLSIIQKFTRSVELMEKMNKKKPLCRSYDTQEMLDIILPNIKLLVEDENWTSALDPKRIEKEYAVIESLEDQYKRVLLTYLMQDWKNIDEVLNLLNIAELYKNIAERFVNLSMMTSYLERH